MQFEKSSFQYLKDLQKNNNRDWFNEHKKEFKALEAKIKGVYSAINDELNKHDQIEKHKMFRIYRDVRFSKNKQPYKTHQKSEQNRAFF